MFLVYAEFLIISHFPKQFLSECPLHKSTEKTAKETREKFAHTQIPTPCHESQDVGQAVIPCSRAPGPLLIFFLSYPKHLPNIPQNNVYCLFQFWKTILLWGRMFVFQKRAAAKALACFFKTPRSICITICAQFQYHLYNKTIIHV